MCEILGVQIFENHRANAQDFSAKLEILMKDKLKRLEFGGKAKIDMKPFSMDAVLNLWDALVVEVTE